MIFRIPDLLYFILAMKDQKVPGMKEKDHKKVI